MPFPMQFRPSALLWVFALVSLTACQPTRQFSWQSATEHSSELHQVERWRAQGKLRLRFEGESQSASFDWQQKKSDYTIHLFGPFGQGSTWLRKKRDRVSLENGEIGKVTAHSAEELMQQELGWQVPVSAMQYWIRGLQDYRIPGEAITTDAQGFIELLLQGGWQIHYKSYQEHNGWRVPRKLIATRDDLELLLVVKDWQLPRAQHLASHTEDIAPIER